MAKSKRGRGSRARKPAPSRAAKAPRRSKKASVSRTRKAKPKASHRQPKRSPQKRRSARPSISKRILDTERAISTLGESAVKRGSITLGQTRRITPTRQGMKAIGRALKAVNKVNRVGKERVFTYDLEGTYRGSDGKLHKFSRRQVGIPRLRDIKPKKGESKTAALNRVVQDRIRREIMGILKDRLGGYTGQEAFKGGRAISKREAAEALRKFKRTREVKIKIRFRREV